MSTWNSPPATATRAPCSPRSGRAASRRLSWTAPSPAHVGQQHPHVPTGLPLPTVLQAVRQEFPTATVGWEQGCPMPRHGDRPPADRDDTERREADRALDAAKALAADSDLCVVVVGDKAGLFGRGTSGEGCDAPDLSLPGDQAALVDAALDTATPVVLVVTSGRPYALGRWADRLSAVVQAFFLTARRR
ncbi:glycoside hydrolase family 3 C-terminal domain-containing protein [Streptomyces longwoodensis]|uniref:glycoside hydrolase family 3 protein n=1 Tax=Streptomyces longwoodensis TaxID=68231 RepID=UPI0036FE07F7